MNCARQVLHSFQLVDFPSDFILCLWVFLYFLLLTLFQMFPFPPLPTSGHHHRVVFVDLVGWGISEGRSYQNPLWCEKFLCWPCCVPHSSGDWTQVPRGTKTPWAQQVTGRKELKRPASLQVPAAPEAGSPFDPAS